MVKTVVILGGSYAGLHVAHYLLKNNKDVKVVVVSKNSHFYWNLASVRAIVPDTFKDEQLFVPLSKILGKYPAERVEIVVGAVDATDFAAKTVRVGERTLPYDELVLATGARTHSAAAPWKASAGYDEAVAALGRARAAVVAAKHIVVAGAGSTGVETACELGFAYGGLTGDAKKEIVLLSAGQGVLNGDAVAGNALGELKKLHVQVRSGAKVVQDSVLPDGKTELVLADGEKILTDCYLPTMGLVPNTEYLDAKYLNEKKNVVVDECHRVKGAEHVWAAGDIVSVPRAGFMITQKHAAGVGRNVDFALKGKQPTLVKGLPMDVFAVATGRSRGVGRMGPVKMLSIMVWMAKGRNMALERMAGYVDGSVA